MKVNYSLIAIVLCICSINVNAQVSLTLEDKEVKKGDVFEMNVSVAGFEKILGMQFSVGWDDTYLRPIGVENFGLEGLGSDQFGLFENKISVQWSDPSATFEGKDLADSTVLFAIKFRAIEKADSAMVRITEDPALIEFFNSDNVILEVVSDTSLIKITDDSMTSTLDLNQSIPLKIYDNYPNPFTNNTTIQIDAEYPQNASLQIFDQKGVEIQTLNLRLNRGENYIDLSSSLFPESGIYHYQLLTDYYAKTKKLAVLR